MKYRINNLEIEINANTDNYFVSFEMDLLDTPYEKVAVNLFDIDIDVLKHTAKDWRPLPNGTRSYYTETDYTVKVNELSYVTTQKEIFDPVTNVEKAMLLTDEMESELTKRISKLIYDNIDDYIANE